VVVAQLVREREALTHLRVHPVHPEHRRCARRAGPDDAVGQVGDHDLQRRAVLDAVEQAGQRRRRLQAELLAVSRARLAPRLRCSDTTAQLAIRAGPARQALEERSDFPLVNPFDDDSPT